jgi:uncharacterized protein
MNGIDIIEIEEMNIKGAYVIDGFPSVGLVGSIVANYIAGTMKLRQIAVVDSDHFPTVSLIKGGIPHSPVRIYGGEMSPGGERLVVFVSEFQPPPHILKQLGIALMDWVEVHKCKLLISPEGLSKKQTGPKTDGQTPNQVVGVGSTPEARELLKNNDIPIFEGGVIIGLSGVLLNEGVNRSFQVITLLSEASTEMPDARAAAAEAIAINKLILNNHLDVKPLLQEAEVIENGLKDMYEKAGKDGEIKKVSTPEMYG